MVTFQKYYNPADFEFEWTKNNYYSWDRKAAHKAALRARNDEMRRLQHEGYDVTAFILRDQIVSKGGIGTGRPHIKLSVTCYGLSANKE